MFVRRKQGERGQAMVETALLAPWIFFLFIGIFDVGFFMFASICTQNAARVAALTYAASTTATVSPCTAALGELAMLPNMIGVTSCGALPVVVPSPSIAAGPDGKTAIRATVTYQTVPLVPIPGVLPGRITLTRTATVRQIVP